MTVHLEVLGGLAGKTAGIAAAGGRLTPNALTELLYPLDRARGFLRSYDDHAERASYAAFVEVVEAGCRIAGGLGRRSGPDW